MSRSAGWLATALVGLLGCSSVELAPTTIKTRQGPAAEQPIGRIVAVPARCGNLSSLNRRTRPGLAASTDSSAIKDLSESDAEACTAQQVDGVDEVVRSALEFYGYSVIDSERLNATTMQRREVLTRETISEGDESRTTTSREATIRGAEFADAPPKVQDEILADLGAEGLLSTRIVVGAMIARSPRRHIDVQVRLLAVRTGELVWASRCRVEAGWVVNEAPIMEAARCAVDAITEVKR